MNQEARVLLFGASVRAAAFSAMRAGWQPWCADLFADADLRGRCPAMRLPGRYPDAFLDLAASAMQVPWAFTGGLENHPFLIRRIAAIRPLLGNGVDTLLRTRDPAFLAQVARRVGMPGPRTGMLTVPPTAGRWLIKPVAGSGGAGIRFWEPHSPLPTSAEYIQEFIDGVSSSAVFVANRRQARLLGVTQQLIGEEWLHAPPFRYSGNIAPLSLPDRLCDALTALGMQLTAEAGLRGLFGVDGILQGERFWPVEINPRYPASVEVLEYATGLRAFAEHCRGCAGEALSTVPVISGEVVGKAILWARQDLTFPHEGPWMPLLREPPPVELLPPYADLPHAGEDIPAGRPILTLFARAANVAECIGALQKHAAETERALYNPS